MGHGRVDSPPDELELDGVPIGADVQEFEGETPCPVVGFIDDTGPGLRRRPFGVKPLTRERESVEMATGEWREPPVDAEDSGTLGSGQLETDAAREGPQKRGVATFTASQTEGPGRFVEIEVEAVGFGIESSHDPTQQPGACRTDDWQPELFDVPGAGIVAEGIDDGVGPRFDVECVRSVRLGVVMSDRLRTRPGWGCESKLFGHEEILRRRCGRDRKSLSGSWFARNLAHSR
jgi:hypothetical protein